MRKNEFKFEYCPEANLCKGAQNFIKYHQFRTSGDVEAFILERVIPYERPDRSLWATGLGASPNCSDIELFLVGHGISTNDCFWIDEKRDSDFWERTYKHAV